MMNLLLIIFFDRSKSIMYYNKYRHAKVKGPVRLIPAENNRSFDH